MVEANNNKEKYWYVFFENPAQKSRVRLSEIKPVNVVLRTLIFATPLYIYLAKVIFKIFFIIQNMMQIFVAWGVGLIVELKKKNNATKK